VNRRRRNAINQVAEYYALASREPEVTRKPRASNPHEDLARRAKVERLLRAIDESVGSDPSEAELVAVYVENLAPEGWEALAGYARCRMPSPTTRAMVVSAIRSRARRSA